ncbi:proline racemase family protein [Desulfonatronovibrio magnus]|uniref:proline racemase family protein n=1 Tax=Desulfonatronovibrio magnus TaxID=698827 RepID=UPI0005EBDD60|nr:proline racemase family protein [Desulfonatronovibrio magnus]
MIPEHILQAFNNCFSQGITTIDSHTAGEYTRLVVSGIEPATGRTMAEKRVAFMSRYDHVRKLLTMEPRGNRDIVAALVTEPATPEAVLGLIYMDARRYPYLCGHATIGAVTTLVQTGLIPAEPDENGLAEMIVDTPSGPMPVQAEIKADRVISVSFTSVPCFVLTMNQGLTIPGIGRVTIDLVFAGGFFAMVDLDQPVLQKLSLDNNQLIALGMQITEQSCSEFKVSHPERPEVCTIDVTEFYRHENPDEGISYVVYGDSHLDRSPCGTGTSAKIALLHHKGLISRHTEYINKGPLKTKFKARIVREVMVGSHQAVEVCITGSASITGLHHFVLDEHDPFPNGFLI